MPRERHWQIGYQKLTHTLFFTRESAHTHTHTHTYPHTHIHTQQLLPAHPPCFRRDGTRRPIMPRRVHPAGRSTGAREQQAGSACSAIDLHRWSCHRSSRRTLPACLVVSSLWKKSKDCEEGRRIRSYCQQPQRMRPWFYHFATPSGS